MITVSVARGVETAGAPAGHPTSRRRPAEQWLGISALLAFLALTTRWLGWSGGLAFLGEGDVDSYLAMSSAAPGLPDEAVGSDYTARFLVHYTVGLLSDVTGLSLPTTYFACLAAVTLGIVTVTSSTLRVIGLRGWAYQACLAVVVLNPYALRYYVIAPGMLADLVFVLGLALALRGMVASRTGIVLAGLVVAVAGRQSALFIAPVFAVWLLVERRGVPRLRTVAQAVGLVAVTTAVYAAVYALTAPFTFSFAPRIPQDTVLPLLADLPGSAITLADHALRVVSPLLLPLVLIGVAVVVRRRRGETLLSRQGWTALAVALVIAAQPLAVGPDFPGFAYNEPRLSALSLVAFAVCLATTLPAPRAAGTRRRPRISAALLLGVLALASLHHLYTVVGPAGAGQFIFLQGMCAAAGGVLLLVLLGQEGAEPGATDDDRSEPAVRRRPGRVQGSAGSPTVEGGPRLPALVRRAPQPS